MAINDVAEWQGKGCIMYQILFVNFWVILCPVFVHWNLKHLINLKKPKNFLKDFYNHICCGVAGNVAAKQEIILKFAWYSSPWETRAPVSVCPLCQAHSGYRLRQSRVIRRTRHGIIKKTRSLSLT